MCLLFSFFFITNMIIQCLVLLRKIAGPSGESACLYFLNGANLLKFCQKGAWPLLDWLNSKTSPCAMSSDTSYCPTLSGSCGGGYEGGVHLFTPRKTGAKRTEKGGGERGSTVQTEKGKCQWHVWRKHNNTTLNHASKKTKRNSQWHAKWAITINIPAKIRLRYDLKLNWKKSGIQP